MKTNVSNINIPLSQTGKTVPHIVSDGARVIISFPAPLLNLYQPSDKKLSEIAISDAASW